MMSLPQQPLQWSAHFGPSLTNSYDQQRQSSSRETQNPEGQSRLRSPIPADPGYGHDPRACGSRRPLRLHGPDAKTIYKRAVANDGAPFLLSVQCSNAFQTSSTAGKPPKNHMNENAKRIRRIMRETQHRTAIKEQSKPTPVKALWRSKQYDNVQSKVKQKLEEDTQRSLSRPQSSQGNFLRAHENTGPKLPRSQSVCDSRRSSIGSSINFETTEMNGKTKPDYVKINSQYVKNVPIARKSTSTEAIQQTREKQNQRLKAYQENQKGRVPDYIERIKDKRDEDIHQARINAPDIECPAGHVKIDNAQRLSTLQQLQFNRAELEKRLSHLPVRNDSVTLRRTKEDIDKKIVELDEAIQIFSKPKVFLKIED